MKKTLLLISILFVSLNVNAQCWNSIYEGGYGYNCFKIKNDGTLWANGDSTLINGLIDPNTGNGYNITTPTQIGTSSNWKSIANGVYHIVAIKTDGTLWAWGSNYYGELGDGTNIGKNVPTRIGNANNWKSVLAGYAFTVAIKTDGTLWAWGLNDSGELGDGTIINKNIPTKIGNANNWSLASIYFDSCHAIKTDGTLWAWGNNFWGVLGDGTNINKSTPIQIGTDTNWKVISNGMTHVLALKVDGTLWSWGGGSFGTVGDGTNNNKRNFPLQIGTSNNWKSVSAGREHSLAIKTDGTLWAWGLNDYGQLGDGTTINKNTPIQIGTATNWKVATSGNWFSTALKTDGALWAWGLNDAGQLGDDTTIDKTAPTQINCSGLDTETFETSSIFLYPNPANDQIIIDCGILADVNGWNIKITNMLGQEVFNQPLNTQQYVVPLNTFSGHGVYFVKLYNAEGSLVYTKKIIVQ